MGKKEYRLKEDTEHRPTTDANDDKKLDDGKSSYNELFAKMYGYPAPKTYCHSTLDPEAKERRDEAVIGAAAWVIILGAVGLLIDLVVHVANRPVGMPTSSRSSSYSSETTEDKLRRVYDSQGIKYDDRMIHEDARAVEKLTREFGK